LRPRGKKDGSQSTQRFREVRKEFYKLPVDSLFTFEWRRSSLKLTAEVVGEKTNNGTIEMQLTVKNTTT
jgi:hypothetical protein